MLVLDHGKLGLIIRVVDGYDVEAARQGLAYADDSPGTLDKALCAAQKVKEDHVTGDVLKVSSHSRQAGRKDDDVVVYVAVVEKLVCECHRDQFSSGSKPCYFE